MHKTNINLPTKTLESSVLFRPGTFITKTPVKRTFWQWLTNQAPDYIEEGKTLLISFDAFVRTTNGLSQRIVKRTTISGKTREAMLHTFKFPESEHHSAVAYYAVFNVETQELLDVIKG